MEITNSLFKTSVATITNYLEFGVGETTKYISSLNHCEMTCVDTDRLWLREVEHHCRNNGGCFPKFLHLEVGPVRNWGYPVDQSYTGTVKTKLKRIIKSCAEPDLVLVDGRFRVLTTLLCLKYLKTNTAFLLDDYTNRPFYTTIEQFITPLAVEDNLFKFYSRSLSTYDLELLDSAVKRYENSAD